MKDSGIAWIGEIPKEWEIIRAKNLFYQSTTKGNDRLVLLSATQDRGVVDKSSLESVVQVSEDADLSTFKTVHVNDFVISLRSFQGGFEISYAEGVISPAYTVFRLAQNSYPHYYRYLFKCNGFISKINSLTVGIREGKNIQYKDFANMLIPDIPLSEQQRIATFLDEKCKEIDALIALQEEMITELQAYKQSVISEAVTKGLAPKVTMKDSGVEWIGEIPEHWNLCKTLYGLIMPITDGPHTTPNLYKEGVPFVSAEAVSTGKGKIDFNHIRGYISEEFYKECCKKYIPALDDIYMIKSGATTGRVAIVDTNKQFTIWSPLAVFRCNTSIMKPKYLFYQLQSNGYQKQIELGWSYGTQQNIGMRTLETLLITIPPLPEQQAIADYLDTQCTRIDSLIALKQAKIESLKEYKKSVIYEYVTGKKEVPATV